MRRFMFLGLTCSLLLGFFWFASHPALAATTHDLSARSAPACTSTGFSEVDDQPIRDSATGMAIGNVGLLADNCGAVKGWASGKVTNLEIRSADGTTLTTRFTSIPQGFFTDVYTPKGEYDPNKIAVYVWAVEQDVSVTPNIRGEQSTNVYPQIGSLGRIGLAGVSLKR